MSAKSGPLQSSAIESLAKIKATLDVLEISGGPANVPSFRDFHTLQVAFKHVWSQALDGRVVQQVDELIAAATALNEDFDVPVPDPSTIEDLVGLKEYINGLKGVVNTVGTLPMDDLIVSAFPTLTPTQWTHLDSAGQTTLADFAATLNAHKSLLTFDLAGAAQQIFRLFQENGVALLAEVLKSHTVTTTLGRIDKLLGDLATRLGQPHAFHIFKPYSINFGLLTTYRQQWIPQAYQVGKLVSTVPLAPGEKRTIKVKTIARRSRAEKESQKSAAERDSASEDIGRAETEAMQKTSDNTNFRLSASGTLSMGIGSISSTSEFGMSQASESSQAKKSFNEATRKAAERVRQERETLIDTASAQESENEGTQELSNPNNELTVTFLLYELERRFLLSTALQEVRPVVMVALDVPMPDEINEVWVLEHAGVLKRALLDDGLQEAFTRIESGAVVADRLDVEIRRANWTTQKALTEKLEHQLGGLISLRDARREEMIRLREQGERYRAGEAGDEQDVAAAVFSGGLSLLFGGGGGPDQTAILEARRKSVEQTIAYMSEELEDLQSRLSRSQSALQEASVAFATSLKEQERSRAVVGKALLHFKQNILHYMHAIWDATHPDQRFFELYHRPVTLIQPAESRCTLRLATAAERNDSGLPTITHDGQLYIVECQPLAAGAELPTRTTTLVEIADLDNPLGFKGNYVVFPLKTCTFITDFMMQEYVDDYFGIRDPANADGYTVPELLQYAAALLNDESSPLTDEEQRALKQVVIRKVSEANLDTDMVVVPTGNLYMEALKGDQALLEDFKLAHRGLDVLKVQEEVRAARLENLRRASRLTQATPVLDQPSADKMVIVSGSDSVSVTE